MRNSVQLQDYADFRPTMYRKASHLHEVLGYSIYGHAGEVYAFTSPVCFDSDEAYRTFTQHLFNDEGAIFVYVIHK